MDNGGYRILSDAEAEELIDRKIAELLAENGMKVDPTPAPKPKVDSFEQIEQDFPDLFGKPKTGG